MVNQALIKVNLIYTNHIIHATAASSFLAMLWCEVRGMPEQSCRTVSFQCNTLQLLYVAAIRRLLDESCTLYLGVKSYGAEQ